MVEYVSGGLLTEKKQPTPYPMESFATKMKVRHVPCVCASLCTLLRPLSRLHVHLWQTPGNTFAEPPTLVLTDLINFGSELQQHVALLATLTYADQTGGKLPRPNVADDAAEVVKCAKWLLANDKVAIDDFELDEAFVTRFALHAGAEIQAMAAFTGGVLAQEVVKVTGKFTPIPGFMHLSAPEVLPETAPAVADTQARSSRFDELASVFGWPFVDRLGSLQYFMVGCGALGCEFMKNFALNNVCCGPQGKLVVTDADRIELSNLSRQFLFREHNVGQPKSRAAAAMAGVMNPAFNVEALEMFVGPKTEEHFNDDFWMGLDGVCNALDNMEARQYVNFSPYFFSLSLTPLTPPLSLLPVQVRGRPVRQVREVAAGERDHGHLRQRRHHLPLQNPHLPRRRQRRRRRRRAHVHVAQFPALDGPLHRVGARPVRAAVQEDWEVLRGVPGEPGGLRGGQDGQGGHGVRPGAVRHPLCHVHVPRDGQPLHRHRRPGTLSSPYLISN
jgi:hypothetical protein